MYFPSPLALVVSVVFMAPVVIAPVVLVIFWLESIEKGSTNDRDPVAGPEKIPSPTTVPTKPTPPPNRRSAEGRDPSATIRVEASDLGDRAERGRKRVEELDMTPEEALSLLLDKASDNHGSD